MTDSLPSPEACKIVEYDGAYRCITHNKTWGAISNPTGPCPCDPGCPICDPASLPDAKEPPHCQTCSCAPGSWGAVSPERLDELINFDYYDNGDDYDDLQSALRHYKALREQCDLADKLADACDAVSVKAQGGVITTTGFIELGFALMAYRACSPSSAGD